MFPVHFSMSIFVVFLNLMFRESYLADFTCIAYSQETQSDRKLPAPLDHHLSVHTSSAMNPVLQVQELCVVDAMQAARGEKQPEVLFSCKAYEPQKRLNRQDIPQWCNSATFNSGITNSFLMGLRMEFMPVLQTQATLSVSEDTCCMIVSSSMLLVFRQNARPQLRLVSSQLFKT